MTSTCKILIFFFFQLRLRVATANHPSFTCSAWHRFFPWCPLRCNLPIYPGLGPALRLHWLSFNRSHLWSLDHGKSRHEENMQLHKERHPDNPGITDLLANCCTTVPPTSYTLYIYLLICECRSFNVAVGLLASFHKFSSFHQFWRDIMFLVMSLWCPVFFICLWWPSHALWVNHGI